jgi:aryl-alcohol dehydrogenase
MQIRAAVARSPAEPFSIEIRDVADPEFGEVLVKVHACGICHTDLAAKL